MFRASNLLFVIENGDHSSFMGHWQSGNSNINAIKAFFVADRINRNVEKKEANVNIKEGHDAQKKILLWFSKKKKKEGWFGYQDRDIINHAVAQRKGPLLNFFFS